MTNVTPTPIPTPEPVPTDLNGVYSEFLGVLSDAVAALIPSLARRGFMTTEFWVQVVGVALTTVFAKVGFSGPVAVQAIVIASPAVVATLYNVLRTLQKKYLADAVTWLHNHVSHDIPTS